MDKLDILSEYEEQCLLVQYLELKNIKFSKIAQETFTRSWGIKIKNKMSGLRRGVPDMLMIISQKNEKDKLIFIEMKRTKGGILSKEQKGWKDALNKCQGVESFVCYGYEEAKELIDNLIKVRG